MTTSLECELLKSDDGQDGSMGRDDEREHFSHFLLLALLTFISAICRVRLEVK